MRPASRSLAIAALIAFFLLCAGGCAHLPRIIVLEDPLSADEHMALGVAYERKGELALAAREYEQALSKDRKLFQARTNLGNVRLAEKRYSEAKGEYLAALALRPADPEATNNYSWAAILSGTGQEDALRWMQAVMSTPAHRSPPLLDTLGVLLGELSRPTEAEAAFAEAGLRCEEKDPTCTEAVRQELREHVNALRVRYQAPTGTPSPAR